MTFPLGDVSFVGKTSFVSFVLNAILMMSIEHTARAMTISDTLYDDDV